MNHKNRRDFLKKIACLGAAGVGSQVTRLGVMNAQAQSTSNYKALVCVFLFGGNDSNNMIVPLDSARYAQYQTMRTALALPQNALLPAAASSYGFHPSMTNIQRLYTQNRAAMVLNVGTLVGPTTKTSLQNGAQRPRNLGSHDDQTQQWQTSDPMGGVSGWGGRVNVRIQNQNTGTIPPGIALNGGNNVFLSAPGTVPANFSNSSSLGLYAFGNGNASTARRNTLQRVITFDSGMQLVGTANGVLGASIRTAQEFNAALASAPAPTVAFPNTGLANQLSQALRLISVRGSLGMNRQIFFVGVGGYDNHENQLGTHANLLATVDGAINAFFANVEALGLMNNVTLFTESEFNRTGNVNSQNGSDHAWGGHHLVFGGAVNPGVYGTFPTLVLRGPDDSGERGNWIPTTGLDQYAATFGSWFGVSDADLRLIFPNLSRFTPQKLDFLRAT
ncbi:MAG: DUF1501 domain-containing protein [Bryobacteraceae bacterium]|nr:DUF1501 domain-containing protein [Bryobacteraceae bacterium]